jgi:hypothetical protein
VTRDDAVARHELRLHAEIVTAMDGQRVQLLKRAGVDQRLDALAGRELAGLVLLGDALLAAALAGLGVAPPHLFQPLVLH